MIISCNSVLFRKYSIEEAMEAIRAAGFDYLETQGMSPFCPHVDVDKDDPIKFAEKVKSFGFKGITSLWPAHGEILSDDLAAVYFDRSAQWAAAAGIPNVMMGDGMKPKNVSLEDAFSRLTEMVLEMIESAERNGITAALEPHGTFSLTKDGLIRILGISESASFGINYDAANIYRSYYYENTQGSQYQIGKVDKQEDELDVVQSIASRVVYMHVKDMTEDKVCCALGSGKVKLKECIEVLRSVGYDGVFSLETDGNGTLQEELTLAKKSMPFFRSIAESFA